MSTTVGTDLERGLDAGVQRLLSLQKPGAWWVAELESNVTMTAQHIFWHEFLRIADDETVQRCANELLARRRPHLHRAGGGHRCVPRLHAHLARPLRPLAMGGDPGDPAGARAPQARV